MRTAEETGGDYDEVLCFCRPYKLSRARISKFFVPFLPFLLIQKCCWWSDHLKKIAVFDRNLNFSDAQYLHSNPVLVMLIRAYWDAVPLKVHKIENFFGSEFEFYTISLLVMLKY